MGRFKLSEVDLNISQRCNLACEFCSVQTLPVASIVEELDLPTLAKLFAEFDELGVETVRIVGGEPFVRNDILSIFALTAQHRFHTNVLTNGMLIKPKHVESMKRHRINLVAFSVDSHQAVSHNASRGSPHAFQQLLKSVALCRDAGLRMRMMTAVTADSVRQLCEIIRFADGLGFEMVNFILLGFNGRARSNLQAFPTYREWANAFVELSVFLDEANLGVHASILAPHEDAIPIELYDPLAEAGKLQLLEKVWGIDYRGFVRSRKHYSRCHAGHDGIAVMPNGDVYGCDLMQGQSEFVAGNIRQQTVSDIFANSPVFRELRRDTALPIGPAQDDDARDFACRQCRAGANAMRKSCGTEAPRRLRPSMPRHI